MVWNTVEDLLKISLLIVVGWCSKENLRINPSNMMLIPFTRKRITQNLSGIKLSEETLTNANEVKYLELVLYIKLTLNSH